MLVPLQKIRTVQKKFLKKMECYIASLLVMLANPERILVLTHYEKFWKIQTDVVKPAFLAGLYASKSLFLFFLCFHYNLTNYPIFKELPDSTSKFIVKTWEEEFKCKLGTIWSDFVLLHASTQIGDIFSLRELSKW